MPEFDLESAFTHAILRPYLALWHRAGQPIAVRPTFNDLSTAACELCIACAHWPERLSAPQAAEVRRIDGFEKLCDTSDSTKHHRLRKPVRDVTIATELVFEGRPSGLRFLRNDLTATSGRWGDFDLLATLRGFVNELVELSGFNGGVVPKIFLPEWPDRDVAEMRLARQSLPVEKAAIKVVTVDCLGRWHPAAMTEVDTVLVPDPELEEFARAIEAGRPPPPLPATRW